MDILYVVKFCYKNLAFYVINWSAPIPIIKKLEPKYSIRMVFNSTVKYLTDIYLDYVEI